MKFLLDTNICIYMFKGLYGLPERIKTIGFDEFTISEITLVELIFGAYKSQQVERNLAIAHEFAQSITVLPIIGALDFYGREKARLRSLGQPIGDLDLLIGTTALANGLTLVTRNVREFSRIQNLNVENWVDS